MKITPLELVKLTKSAKNQSIKMQNRLLLYWGTMLFVIFAALLVVLSFTGVFSNAEERVEQTLTVQHKNTYQEMTEQFGKLTAKGIVLSEQMADLLSDELFNKPVSSLNDSPEMLARLELLLYNNLNTVLQSGACSGAFAIIDATTNTQISNAADSKAGLFIRFANLNSNNEVNQDVTVYRGIPDIAREYGVELHNRWKLEFDVSKLPGYETALAFSGTRVADGCFWTDKMVLTDTWENTFLLMIPVMLSDGSVCGVCGVEVSELYFSLSYPTAESEFGRMMTILAPIVGDELMVSQGMIGSLNGSYIRESEEFVIKEGKTFNTYIGRDSSFIGLQQETEMILEDGTPLYAITLVPREYYLREDRMSQIAWIISTVLLFVVMLLISFVLVKNFVKPIAQSLEAIRDDHFEDAKNSGISEIDSLLSHIKERQTSQSSLPSDIEELFNEFAQRAERLTPTERSIIKYYSDGKEVSEISELCFISINTVRKHNANIYKKLGIGSKEELVLYTELFRRCGRLDELF